MKPQQASRAMGLAAAVSLSLAGGSISAQTTFYDGPSRSYGSIVDRGSIPSVSENDLQRDQRRLKKEAERREVQERKLKAREESAQRARDARVPYVPKTPTTNNVQTANQQPNSMTPEKMSESLFASQSAAAVVDVPPQREGMKLIAVGDEFFYYADGRFYIENGASMAEVPAPVGALVLSLPPDFATVMAGGRRYYQAGLSFFERVLVSGKAGFKVVPPPEGATVSGSVSDTVE